MTGKDKCRILREIRQEIARSNDISLVTSECSHQGACRGTCPKCESEVRRLEAQLEKRRLAGKRIALAGISIGTMLALSGCEAIETAKEKVMPAPTPESIDMLYGEVEDIDMLMGDVPRNPDESNE